MSIENNRARGAFIPPVLMMLVMMLIMPLSSHAQEVEGVSLSSSGDGDVVSIQSDATLKYEVFDLKAPSRVVLMLPGASLKKGIEPLRNSKGPVKSIFASASKQGVKVEIGLDRDLKYDIAQQGKKLTLRFAASPSGSAGKHSAAVLEDLNVRDRGDVTELVLRGQHMDASHDALVTNNGRTMILDLWGATSKLAKEHYPVATQKVKSVTVGQADGRVRLVVSLVPGEKVHHQVDATSNEMVVRFGKVAPARQQGVVKVEDVHFKPDDRIAHLMIRTDAANPVVSLHQQGSNVVMDIDKAVLAKGQQRSQDVSEFPGPVKQVDAYKVDDKVRIVARLRDKVDVSSFQQGNVLTVTLEPKSLANARKSAEAGGQHVYTGQKVTFDFKDIDIRNALKLIAEMSNLNIIMSDDVSGKLTMRLVNVPWDQALDIILSARGLGKERQGNVLRIAPVKVLAAERKSRLDARKGSEQLEPLITATIPLNYASVKDIKKMLGGNASGSTSGAASASQSQTSGQGAVTSNGTRFSLLSPRGTFLVDERTNMLVVRDTRESVNNIKRLITALDKPVKQVLIEARIVEATDNFTRDLGVRWGGQATSNSPNVTIGGAQGSTNPTSNTANTATASQGYLVDLPATGVGAGTGGAIGFNFGYLQGLVNLNLELSAAEADGKIKIVSNPRVVTTNLKPAKINQGSDIPFLNSSSANTGTTVTFKKATLGLDVTPQISSDNRVMLHVVATKDAPSTSLVQGNPIISTKKIDTNILMNNGETVVIGGIYTRDKENTTNAVPGFSKIPILGWLFKKNSKIDKKTELLIFITPTILKTGPSPNSDVAQSS